MEERKFLLGNNIKKYRENKGWSQVQLAERIAISRPSVSLWEQGKSEPSISVLVNIAKVLGVSLDMLVGNDEKTKRVIVLDTSVLMKRPTILHELIGKFDEVIIPNIVINELNRLKDRRQNNRPWLILKSINEIKEEKTEPGLSKKLIISEDSNKQKSNDENIFDAAVARAQITFKDKVYMFTEDIDFAFLYKRKLPNLELLRLANYVETFADEVSCDPIKTGNFFQLVKNKKVEEAKEYYKNYFKDIDINFPDSETGLTPLIQSVRNKDVKMVEFLINQKEINLDRKDKHKYYFAPLHHVAQLKMSNTDILKLLLERGADSELGSDGKNSGNTPLMVCAWGGYIEGVRILLDYKKDICLNQQDSNGYTALIKACIKKNYDIAMLLVDRTDITIRSRENKTAYDYIDFNDPNAEELLMKLKKKKVENI